MKFKKHWHYFVLLLVLLLVNPIVLETSEIFFGIVGRAIFSAMMGGAMLIVIIMWIVFATSKKDSSLKQPIKDSLSRQDSKNEVRLFKGKYSSKQYYYVSLGSLLLIVFAFLFYWFQYRPSNASKECSRMILDKQQEARENYDYENCRDLKSGIIKIGSEEHRKSGRCRDYTARMTNSFEGYKDDYESCLREKGIAD